MKNIIVTLAVIIATITTYGQTVINFNKYNITGYTEQVCTEVGLEEATVVVRTMPMTYKNVKAVVVRESINNYSIYTAAGSTLHDVLKAIAHELVHIKQDIEGKLDVNKGTTKLDAQGNAVYVSKVARKLEKEARTLGGAAYTKILPQFNYLQ